MDIFQVMQDRRSIRAYTDQVVSQEQLFQVLEAGRIAPSWENKQCWSYVVVSDPALKARLGEVARYNPDRTAFEKATFVLVLCANPRQSGNYEGKPYYMTDAAISLEHVVLAAAALGLGTCWVGWINEQAIKDLLGIPENQRVVALTPLGYPAQSPGPRPRKELGKMAFLDTWGQPLPDPGDATQKK